MLDPRNRGALLEALRPPPRYVVDCALATTYSLDLYALLTAPLAFSLYDRVAAREHGERLDSFALLHAVRRHAERLVVFCEAGCIARPKGFRQLLAYLEDAVVQVRARHETGVFHPKLWVERLTSVDGPVRYRVLVLSRNLTFDRSWDTMLTLDGELVDRKLAISDSKPLAEFVEALPSLALDAGVLSDRRRQIVTTIADELRRVRFELPEAVDAMRFWPLGHDEKRRDPFADERIERLLVVSPFLAADRLKRLASEGKRHVLVSRVDELERIPRSVLDAFSEVHVLHDAAEDVDEETQVRADEGVSGAPVGPIPPSRGLHAKTYVADDGWRAHVWTGSANASDAAFTQNVELLVQLTGPKSKLGVDVTLDGRADALGLRTLLVPFVAPDEPVAPTELETKLGDVLRRASRVISRSSWVAHVDGVDTFDVRLTTRGGLPALPSGASVRVWPISLTTDRALPLVDGGARFEGCSFQALTSFFAFEVTATEGTTSEWCEFVLRVALEGAPSDRSARVLHALLDDPAKVLRFLRMLLAADAIEALAFLEDEGASSEGTAGAERNRSDAVPVFESLLRMLDRDPDRLVDIDRLFTELRATPEGKKLLPPEIEEVWLPVWAAYCSTRRPA